MFTALRLAAHRAAAGGPDEPVYRFVLREYVGWLVRKRFNLEWYIEGGRTRTGKLRPPRLGLLAYLVEAFRSARRPEESPGQVHLVPVAIVYDQLYEVRTMAAEEHGAEKRPESLGWALGYARAQGRGLGAVHVRFGEPLALAEGLEESGQSVEKLAFEVCHRINRATPLTANALVSLALLGVDRALTVDQTAAVLAPCSTTWSAGAWRWPGASTWLTPAPSGPPSTPSPACCARTALSGDTPAPPGSAPSRCGRWPATWKPPSTATPASTSS